jgi:hypothetical protein
MKAAAAISSHVAETGSTPVRQKMAYREEMILRDENRSRSTGEGERI